MHRLICFFLILLFFSCVSSYKDELFVVFLSTSKFWFNYRQGTNILLIYNQLKQYGIKDENILLLIPENHACNPRNNQPGTVTCYDDQTYPNLYKNIELDYKHTDVRVDNFLNILRGKFPENLPQSKKFFPHKNSRLLIYMTGHGGDQYMKMQDTHVISSYDFGKTLKELHEKNLYKEILLVSDSCEAVTLFDHLDIPNAFAIGSSSKGIKSYSFGNDKLIHLSKVDRFSLKASEFLESQFSQNRNLKLSDMLKIFDSVYLQGPYDTKNLHKDKNENNIYLKNYFSNTYSEEILFHNITQFSSEEKHFYESLEKIL